VIVCENLHSCCSMVSCLSTMQCFITILMFRICRRPRTRRKPFTSSYVPDLAPCDIFFVSSGQEATERMQNWICRHHQHCCLGVLNPSEKGWLQGCNWPPATLMWSSAKTLEGTMWITVHAGLYSFCTANTFPSMLTSIVYCQSWQ
jgi:hypothetical protein